MLVIKPPVGKDFVQLFHESLSIRAVLTGTQAHFFYSVVVIFVTTISSQIPSAEEELVSLTYVCRRGT